MNITANKNDVNLTIPNQKFQAAIVAFHPDLTGGDPVITYRQMCQDVEELRCLARKAGVSLEPSQHNFQSALRTDLARKAKQALEALPVETLRKIAYTENFIFPTLTQDPADTRRASSLVYWLNPIYCPGTAHVVQNKAQTRWNDQAEPERVETLIKETSLHRTLDQAGHSTPSPSVKYSDLPTYPAHQVIVKTRLTRLQDRIDQTARKLARQYGDQDELAAEMRLAILEKAQQDPDFLLQTDAYIVQHGVWAIKQQARDRQRIQATPLHDEIVADTYDGVSAIMDRDTILAALPEELRRVVELMLQNPGHYLIGNRINTTRLAEELGQSWWTANNRLEQIQNILSRKNLAGALA